MVKEKNTTGKKHAFKEAMYIEKKERRLQLVRGSLMFLIFVPPGSFLLFYCFHAYGYPPYDSGYFFAIITLGFAMVLSGIIIFLYNILQVPPMIFKTGYFPGTHHISAGNITMLISGKVNVTPWKKIEHVCVIELGGWKRPEKYLEVEKKNGGLDLIKVNEKELEVVLSMFREKVGKSVEKG